MINRQLVHFDTSGQRVILNPGQLVNTGGDYYDVAGGGGGGSPGYYGSFYDTTNQTAAAINTGYPITLDTTVESNGVSIVSGSRVTVANGGVYNIQFSAQLVNTDTSIYEVTMWLRLNGTNIPYSAGAVSVPNRHGGVNGQIIPAWNYVMTLSAGDYLQFYWQTPSTQVYIEKVIDGAAPISPSMIVTVTQVASTVAGPTGPAGTSLLYGSVAPSAGTGNNGDFYIDTTTNYLYGPKASGAWPAGTPLTAGTGPAGGDLTGTYPNPTLAAVATAATLGSATKSLTVTIDAKGRVTSMTENTITATDATKLPLAGGTMTGNLITAAGVRVGIQQATPAAALDVGVTRRFTVYPDYAGLGDIPANTALIGSYAANLAYFPETSAGGVGYKVIFGYYNGATVKSAIEYANTTGSALAQIDILKGGGNVTVGSAASVAARNGITATNSSANAAAEAGFAATTGAGTGFFGVGSSASSKVAGLMCYTADAVPWTVWTNGLRRMSINSDGLCGIGVANATATLQLKAGTATANTAPLKINSGTVMSTPEDGCVEYNGTKWYTTIGTDRREILRGATYSPTLTPTAVAANSESIQSFTITGLIVPCSINISPPAAMSGLGIMWSRVSATNTLDVCFRNFTAGSLTPPSGTWRIECARS